jgi:hypothetical protein
MINQLKVKDKKCITCGNMFRPFMTTARACSEKCAIQYGIKQTAKRLEKQVAEYKAELRAEKKEAKDKLIDHQAYLQKEIQTIARLIDFKCLCLARNIIPYKKNGGHVFTNKGNINMNMNLHNIFMQSAQSNGSQQDDGLMRDGVARVFSVEYLQFINGLKATPIMKYTNEDYKEIRGRAKLVIKHITELNKDLILHRTASERIELRNWANEQLEIYPKQFLIFKIRSL